MTRYGRVLITIVFVGLLLTPSLIRRFGQPASARSDDGSVNALSQYGFRLTDATTAAGLDFVHHGPTLDSEAVAHHAAGGVDGCGRLRGRLRS
ncbi:MAG: hypothetical protein QM736_00765 [Vicinamibacterales bacterium]